ncbi:MAG: hypothetical protein AAFQ82_16980, partial [Myxococcota bacterium]
MNRKAGRASLAFLLVFAGACSSEEEREPDELPEEAFEPEPGQIAEQPEDRSDDTHPWFMFPEEAETAFPSDYSEEELTNPELDRRFGSLQASDLSTYAAMQYSAYPASREPCAPGASCPPVIRVRLTAQNVPDGRSDLVGATVGVFLNTNPANGEVTRDYVVLDRVNAAGGLETLSLSTDSELGRQTEPGINGPYPEDMPPVNFPEIDCDDPQDREKILAAWVRAHYYVWRGYQLMEFIGSSGGCRETYWSDGYRSDLEAANWSPRNWFGSFIKFRFDAVRKVVDKTWDRFRTNKAGGIDITLRCVEFEDTLDPCFSGTPGAYNFPVGAISLCPVVLREENETHQRAQLLVHEMLHHTGVSWKPDDLWFGDTVKDVQFHGGHVDKPCGLGVVEKMYGAERAMHLSLTPTCGHADVPKVEGVVVDVSERDVGVPAGWSER